jgi:hypothetical protein
MASKKLKHSHARRLGNLPIIGEVNAAWIPELDDSSRRGVPRVVYEIERCEVLQGVVSVACADGDVNGEKAHGAASTMFRNSPLIPAVDDESRVPGLERLRHPVRHVSRIEIHGRAGMHENQRREWAATAWLEDAHAGRIREETRLLGFSGKLQPVDRVRPGAIVLIIQIGLSFTPRRLLGCRFAPLDRSCRRDRDHQFPRAPLSGLPAERASVSYSGLSQWGFHATSQRCWSGS